MISADQGYLEISLPLAVTDVTGEWISKNNTLQYSPTLSIPERLHEQGRLNQMKSLHGLFVFLLVMFSFQTNLYADTSSDLIAASQEGKLEIVKSLIEKGADIKAKK